MRQHTHTMLTTDIECGQRQCEISRALPDIPDVLHQIIGEFAIDRRGPAYFRHMLDVVGEGQTIHDMPSQTAIDIWFKVSDTICSISVYSSISRDHVKIRLATFDTNGIYEGSEVINLSYESAWHFAIGGQFGDAYYHIAELFTGMLPIDSDTIEMIQRGLTERIAARCAVYDCAETARIRGYGGAQT